MAYRTGGVRWVARLMVVLSVPFSIAWLNCDMTTAFSLANIQFLLSLLEPADEDVSRMSLSSLYDLSCWIMQPVRDSSCVPL